MKYIRNGIKIEAITFDDLIEIGIQQGGTIVDGMPWAFIYRRTPIIHKTNDCYDIPTMANGIRHITRDSMILIGVDGRLYPVPKDEFNARYCTSR